MFSSADLAGMQATQSVHMMDTCRILSRVAGAQDQYGMPAVSFTEGSDLACGMSFPGTRGEAKGTQEALSAVRFRLPYGTVVRTQDRIKVTKRFGNVLSTPEVYEVDGEPGSGPSGVVVNARRVTASDD